MGDARALPRGLAVGVIMDGNGRWAIERGLPVTDGHRAGGTALRRTVEAALDLHVAELTAYAFSTENWQREPDEVQGIMQLFVELLQREVPFLVEEGVRMRFLGRRSELADPILECMRWAETETAAGERMTLAVAFNYGGRAEIVDAARAAVADVGVEALDEQTLAHHLYLADMRDPDMIIRTGGEQRTSNFMVWQGAYSELVFSDVLWPDFGHDQLAECIVEYGRRERRFGRREALEARAAGGA